MNSSRGSLAVGLEDHESERLVQGFHCATGKDDLTGLRSLRQAFEVLRDNRIFGVRPRHLFLVPRRYLQDVNVLPTRLACWAKEWPVGKIAIATSAARHLPASSPFIGFAFR